MKAVTKWGSFVIFLITLILFINSETFSLLMKGDIDSISASGGLWMLLLLSLMLMIIQNLFTVIPLILLITVNVTLFDFVFGYVWSWMTSLIGATVSFFIVRFWFQEFFHKKVKESIKEKIRSNGFAYVFIGRVFPFVPTSLINIAAGASTIKFKHFIISTLLGNMVYMFVLALIPLGIMSLDEEYYVYFPIIILFVIGYFIYKMIKKKAKDQCDIR